MFKDLLFEFPSFSIAGGGHTKAALDKLKLTDKLSYVNTAGGVLTEFLMGKLLGVTALEKTNKKRIGHCCSSVACEVGNRPKKTFKALLFSSPEVPCHVRLTSAHDC